MAHYPDPHPDCNAGSRIDTDHCGRIRATIFRRARAFSLMELLVVMFIIGAMTAMALPAIGSARRHGKLLVCGSNMRQISIGYFNYALEHQRLPAKYHVKKNTLSAQEIADGKKLNTTTEGFQTVLAPYVAAETFRDPADAGDRLDPTPIWLRKGLSYDLHGAEYADKKFATDTKKQIESTFEWLVGANTGDNKGKTGFNKDVVKEMFKPWEASDPAKVQEKVGKGELGPIDWHGGAINIVLGSSRTGVVKTREQEKAFKGDGVDD